ncbi:MAG: hypothetical protein HZC01_02700 [Candidatus Kerfeldbacteria bacterium]|nr:hypothetical protein [Candidatus Kerfeldbacteria bacterium]
MRQTFRVIVIFLLVTGWLFSGWPPLSDSFPSQPESAWATVSNNGRLYYGDGTNTVLRFQENAYDFDFSTGEESYTHGASASLIRFIVAKPAVTRDEVMVGILKADGQLTVIKGVNGYDVNTDYSTAWSNTGTTPAMTCEGTEADCSRAFDIAYERLSGRAMVVYADNVNQKLYYCYYDGTNWGPVSNCAPTNGTNDITLSSNGRPTFVSLKPKGGSNELLLGVGIDVAGTHEVEAYRWTGSTWSNQVVATDTTNASSSGNEQGAVFDVEWESNSGDALVMYATTATSNEIKYKLLPSGGSWGTEQGGFETLTNGAVTVWVNAESDPQSDRIAIATNDTSNDFNGAVWKGNGTSAGFTALVSDGTLEGGNGSTPGPAYTDVQWEQTGSEFLFVLMDAGAGDTGAYVRYACTGSGCSVSTAQTAITTTGLTDDAQMIRTAASRNSDDIMVLLTDIDNNLITQHWNGTAWETGDAGVLEASLSLCSADNIATGCSAMPAAFTYIPYSPWSRNWKFWQGTDTTDTPTNQLANENVAPTSFSGKFRLRFSVAELSGMGQDNSRKKLQYATADPDATSTTWTDVDDPGGTGAAWRYFDCNGGSSVCDDNGALGGTTLSGSPTVGWWTLDKDAVGGAAMDHAALQLRELEFPVEAYNVASSTTYYFRMYDVDQGRPVRREQDNDGSNDCATATCTYPSLTTASGSLTVDIVDSGGSSVSSPSMVMNNATFSFTFQTVTGSFGISSQQIRVTNTTGTATWTLSLAASATTAVWDSVGTDYDFNDPTAGAADGGDADSVGGRLTIDPSVSTITPQGGCSTTGLTKGASTGFSEGVTNTITLVTAGASTGTGCYWDVTGIGVSQTIPMEQPIASDYDINMVLSVVAS